MKRTTASPSAQTTESRCGQSPFIHTKNLLERVKQLPSHDLMPNDSQSKPESAHDEVSGQESQVAKTPIQGDAPLAEADNRDGGTPGGAIQLKTPNPALVRDLWRDLLGEEDAARDAKAQGRVMGPITGFGELDRELGGFLAAGLHTLLAAPGVGKTTLALQIATQSGGPVLYVSAEMRRVELLRRLIARQTNTFLGKLRGGALSHAELVRLAKQTAEKSPQLALFDAQEAVAVSGGAGACAKALEARAEALRAHFNSPHVLIVIDSVTEWAPLAVAGGEISNDYALAEHAINSLKTLASNLACPVLVIAHRHRAAQNSGADRLHGAKGTGRFEYISESVWDMERLKEAPPEEGASYVGLTLLKNRYGANNTTFRLLFEGRVQRFSPA